MGTLNVPISINGGGSTPTTLDDRELFVNTTTKYLYVGLPDKTVTKVNAGTADKANKISKSWLNIDVTNDTPVFNVGNLSCNGSIFTPKSGSTTYEFNKPTFTDTQKIVLSNNVYGSTLPTTGVQGQLFFKVR